MRRVDVKSTAGARDKQSRQRNKEVGKIWISRYRVYVQMELEGAQQVSED